jgi:hypothetical protein
VVDWSTHVPLEPNCRHITGLVVLQLLPDFRHSPYWFPHDACVKYAAASSEAPRVTVVQVEVPDVHRLLALTVHDPPEQYPLLHEPEAVPFAIFLW